MGEDVKVLQATLGKYDDISEDEHRAFIWFKDFKASFYVGNDNIVGQVMSPIANAYGARLNEISNFYSIDGVVPGMTKNQVKDIWGPTDSEGTHALNYKNLGGTTNLGLRFYLSAYFTGDEPDISLSYFVADIEKSETKLTDNTSQHSTNITDGILKYALIFFKFLFETLGKIGSWLVKVSMRKLRELFKI